MSNPNTDSMPTYKISIGTPGVFTNDASIDMAAKINSEISAAPAGARIVITFNPGSYGIGSSILVPSNTSIVGNDVTLNYIPEANSLGKFGGMIANKDAYYYGSQVYINQTDGTSAVLQTWNPSHTGNNETMSGAVPGIVDNNISVQGITFNLGTWRIFGTWFTNCQNIDVQNNTYIGGVDGNAFVNVVNGIVAANLGLGQNNAAFDNWNGPTNISVEGNSTYMSATPNTGWSVLMNATPSGDPMNPGNANNDGIIDNLFSEGVQGETGVLANALLSYGFDTESLIVQQGNVDSLNGLPNQNALYSDSPMQNLFVQNEVVSGLDSSSAGFLVESSGSAAPDVTDHTSIFGNIISGNFGNQHLIENIGNSPATTNNLVYGPDASSESLWTSSLNGSLAQSGNVEISGPDAYYGTILSPEYDIKAPASLFATAGAVTEIPGITVIDSGKTEQLSVTLLVNFGTLSLPDAPSYSQQTNVDGENEYIITGNSKQINADLKGLSYISNSAGWDDAIEIISVDQNGINADRYIPVINLTGTSSASNITTLSPSTLVDLGLQPDIVAGVTYGPDYQGGAILASSGINTITMGNSISVVLSEGGENTIFGGNGPGYIATGDGITSIDLESGGNFTIADGLGVTSIDAASGDNTIEGGAGDSTISAGSGSNTILGGLGNLTVTGGSGSLNITTLPQDGGLLTASLGSGGGTIYALSGTDIISTTSLATDAIFMGLGHDTLHSGGNDFIATGAGDATIDASLGGADFIIGGSGKLKFIGGSNSAFIYPAASSDLIANSGNLTVESGGNFLLQIKPHTDGIRTIVLPGLSNGVILSGYENPNILKQVDQGGILNVTMSDGTLIEMPDPSGQAVSFVRSSPKNVSNTSDITGVAAGGIAKETWKMVFDGVSLTSDASCWAPNLRWLY